MAKGPVKSTAAIEKLIDEKQRIERWLERLDSAADKASPQVRDRVASDYRKRLEKVIEELQGYRDEVASSLSEKTAEQSRLAAAEAAASERLSEAELRHAVGEYDEKEWSRLRTDVLEELVKVREALKGVDREIETLESVVALIDQPTPAADESPDIPEPKSAVEEAVAAATRAAETAEPRDAKPGKRPQTDAFDELAFLKSVTEDDAHGPSAKRAAEVQAESGRAEKAAAAAARQGKEGGKPKKTLKCAECGAENLPTEWYCERCGAELAAV
jgi:hypothetical protein